MQGVALGLWSFCYALLYHAKSFFRLSHCLAYLPLSSLSVSASFIYSLCSLLSSPPASFYYWSSIQGMIGWM